MVPILMYTPYLSPGGTHLEWSGKINFNAGFESGCFTDGINEIEKFKIINNNVFICDNSDSKWYYVGNLLDKDIIFNDNMIYEFLDTYEFNSTNEK